jgi:hypothetical protein
MSKYILQRSGHCPEAKYMLFERFKDNTIQVKKDPFVLVYTGNYKALSLMIKKGMSVHLRNEKDQTLFHYAILYNQVKVACLLKANGATLDSTDKFGQTPEDAIRYKNTPEFLELLLPCEQQEIQETSLSGEEGVNLCCSIF